MEENNNTYLTNSSKYTSHTLQHFLTFYLFIMHIESWHIETIRDERELGGYEELQRNTKETLKLDRKAQHFFRTLLFGVTTDKLFKFQVFSSAKTNLVSHFYIDIIFPAHLFQVRDISYNRWKEICINANFKFKATKERIMLEKEATGIFKWINSCSENSSLNFTFNKSKLNRNSTPLEKFNLAQDLVTVKKRYKFRAVKFPQMNNEIEVSLERITNEKLRKTVSFGIYNDSPLTFEKYQSLSLGDFRIDSIFMGNCHDQSKFFKRDLVPTWAVSSFSNNDTSCFERLKLKVFDVEWSKLEFYKISVKTSQDIKKKKINILPFLKYLKPWKLSKDQLLFLNWKPFDAYKNSDTVAKITAESIDTDLSFEVRSSPINFQILEYNCLDLISNDKENKECVRIEIQTCFANNKENKDEYALNEDLSPTEQNIFNNSTTENTENTSLVPQKRSIIDEELRSILELKRKRKKEGDVHANTNKQKTLYGSSILTLLHKNQPQDAVSIRSNVSGNSNERSINTDTPPPKLEHLETSLNINKKPTVILNMEKIEVNHRILQCLVNTYDIDIIEDKTCFPCDFILNSTACIIRIQLDKFFQSATTTHLFYDSNLQKLIKEYKRVIVLVEYDQVLLSVDREIFWKIQLYLSHLALEVHFVGSTTKEIAKWIMILSSKYATCNFTELPAYDMVQEDEKILYELRFNMFLVKDILSITPLKELLTNISGRRFNRLPSVLTKTQLRRLERLVTASW